MAIEILNTLFGISGEIFVDMSFTTFLTVFALASFFFIIGRRQLKDKRRRSLTPDLFFYALSFIIGLTAMIGITLGYLINNVFVALILFIMLSVFYVFIRPAFNMVFDIFG